jgi:hypothetical protein
MDNSDFGEKIGEFIEDVIDSFTGNERQSDLTQFAQRHQFEFQKRLSMSSLDYELKSLQLFKTKGKKKIRHVLQRKSKNLKADIRIFDLGQQSDWGKYKTTAILIESDLFKFPEFIIRPKKATEKLTGFFASKDPVAGRYPAFAKAFTVDGIEEEQLSFFVTEKLTELLLKEPNVTVEGLKKYLLLYEKNKLKDPEDLLPFYDFALDLTYILLFDNSNEFV